MAQAKQSSTVFAQSEGSAHDRKKKERPTMASAVGEAKGVNLNKAPENELERVGGLGRERAHRITEARPLRSWEDVKKIEGFSDKLVSDLKNSGATL